jgi:hypothetical protein
MNKPKALRVMNPPNIAHRIAIVRGIKVLLDSDLAELYEIKTKVLLQAVKRNDSRFPPDFMFQLSSDEFANLRSQFVTSSWGGRRHAPYAFTEQGVAMLSSVLNSPRAIAVNIEIMRTFVRLREVLASGRELADKLALLEQRVDKNDKTISAILDAIRELISPVAPKRPPIGFVR